MCNVKNVAHIVIKSINFVFCVCFMCTHRCIFYVNIFVWVKKHFVVHVCFILVVLPFCIIKGRFFCVFLFRIYLVSSNLQLIL